MKSSNSNARFAKQIPVWTHQDSLVLLIHVRHSLHRAGECKEPNILSYLWSSGVWESNPWCRGRLLLMVVAVTCSSSHTHSQLESDADSYTSLFVPHAVCCKEVPCVRKREGGETWVTTGDKKRGQNGSMIRKWITFTKCSCWVPQGAKISSCCVLQHTIHGMVFKETSELSYNILNHSAQTPASAPSLVEFHRPILPSYIQQQSGLLLKLISIPNKYSETFSLLNGKVNVI